MHCKELLKLIGVRTMNKRMKSISVGLQKVLKSPKKTKTKSYGKLDLVFRDIKRVRIAFKINRFAHKAILWKILIF